MAGFGNKNRLDTTFDNEVKIEMERSRTSLTYIKASKIAFFSCILFFIALMSVNQKEIYAARVPSITYQAHSQNYGWLSLVRDGATAGTIDQSMRLEALKINLKSGNTSMVSYRAHVADIGWQAWKTSGQQAGTTDQGKRIEAVQIRLTGAYANRYDIYYRVHVAYRGWLGWAKNGATAGSTGIALRAEAIQIKLVRKGTVIPAGGSASLSMPSLTYRSHVQYIGWQGSVSAGKTAGTTGQGLRLEALQIKLKNFDGKSGISYRAHVAGSGWQGWKGSGQTIGTTDQSKAIEAVQINLSNGMGNYFDIYYRMHVLNYGWLGWAKNGASAGTTGGGVQAEAIQIQLVGKGEVFDTGNKVAYHDLSKSNTQLKTSDGSVSNMAPKDYSSEGCVSWVKDRSKLIGITLPGTGLNSYGLYGASAYWTNLPSRYARRSEPSVNALAVWKYAGNASYRNYGHVAFVEKIEGDNITLSEGGLPRRYTLANCTGVRSVTINKNQIGK